VYIYIYVFTFLLRQKRRHRQYERGKKEQQGNYFLTSPAELIEAMYMPRVISSSFYVELKAGGNRCMFQMV